MLPVPARPELAPMSALSDPSSQYSVYAVFVVSLTSDIVLLATGASMTVRSPLVLAKVIVDAEPGV
jgi:hypothetical protein